MRPRRCSARVQRAETSRRGGSCARERGETPDPRRNTLDGLQTSRPRTPPARPRDASGWQALATATRASASAAVTPRLPKADGLHACASPFEHIPTRERTSHRRNEAMTRPARNAATDTSTASARADANRANAALSTGPRTAAGLAASSANATTHGLTARSIVVRGEAVEVWEVFRAEAVADLAPVGFVEVQLAERVAELLWRLRRAGAAEAVVAAHVARSAEREALDAARAAVTEAERVHLPEGVDLEVFRSYDARAVACGEVFRKALDRKALDAAPAGEPGPVLCAATLVVELAGSPGWSEYNDFEAARDWTLGALRSLALVYADLAGAPDPDRAATRLLRRAQTALLRRRVRALEVARDATQRADLARSLAPVGVAAEPVRRHEAHLQRQLNATLRALDAARARRRP